MIKCPNPDCGYENVDGTQFCEGCGEELPQNTAAAAGGAAATAAPAAGDNGIKCPACDNINPPDNLVCEVCGTDLKIATPMSDDPGIAPTGAATAVTAPPIAGDAATAPPVAGVLDTPAGSVGGTGGGIDTGGADAGGATDGTPIGMTGGSTIGGDATGGGAGGGGITGSGTIDIPSTPPPAGAGLASPPAGVGQPAIDTTGIGAPVTPGIPSPPPGVDIGATSVTPTSPVTAGPAPVAAAPDTPVTAPDAGAAPVAAASGAAQGNLAPGRVRLTVEQGMTVGAQFVLGDVEMQVGREDEEESIYPDIDLSDQDAGYVHRRHATIRFENGGLTVTHLGGTNKTRINNRPLPDNVPQPVNIGDKIAFGKVVLRVQQN